MLERLLLRHLEPKKKHLKRLEPLKLTVQKSFSDFKKILSKCSKFANADHKRKATKKEPFEALFRNGGREETRTPMPKAPDPKSGASTNFATRP